jgi:hypothetical protein
MTIVDTHPAETARTAPAPARRDTALGRAAVPRSGGASVPDPTGNAVPARVLHALTALSALAGVALDLWAAYSTRSWLPAGAGFSTTFGPGWDGSLNRLAYFTTQSNLLVAAVSLALLVRPDPRTALLRALRVSALTSILLTGLVYAMVLAGPSLGGDFPVHVIVQTTLEHVLTPLFAVAAWMVSVRRPPSWRELALTPVLPALYLMATLARGALIDWYPYTFVDVPALGYAQVTRNAALVAVLLPVIAATLGLLGRALAPGRRDPVAPAPPQIPDEER